MLEQQAVIEDIEAELTRLEAMRLDDLRTYWDARWGCPPTLRSALLLRHMIAWRIQAAAFGGLDSRTKAKLRGSTVPRPPGPPPGSHLIREYRGVQHRVEVGEGTGSRNRRADRGMDEEDSGKE